MRKKIIGITGQRLIPQIMGNTPMFAVRKSYIDLFQKQGVVPIALPNSWSTAILNNYLRIIDGLCVTGGGDVHPKNYQSKKEKYTGKFHMDIDEERDFTESFLIKGIIKKNKPLLGICRGCQMINVVMGGNLTQHLGMGRSKNREVHLTTPEKGGWDIKTHKVMIESDSKYFSIVKKKQFSVNSIHHQAINKLGKGLRVAAKSPEGINEAIEGTGESFIFGVQWHPEKMVLDHSTKRLIKAFIKA